MKNSYFVFGTRYCGFEDIKEWLPFDITYCDVQSFKITNHKSELNPMYYFPETSLVFHEEVVLARNKGNYQKTIIVYRDLKDVIEKILKKTRISVDEAVNKQINLFEEYTDELIGESSKIPEPYFMPIFYDKWMCDINYRNDIADQLGFVNTDEVVYNTERNYRLRDKVRFKRQITTRVKELNARI